jgi:Ca-activated chloride channel family protein
LAIYKASFWIYIAALLTHKTFKIMRQKLIITAIFLLLYGLSFGQAGGLKGKLIDKSNKEPIVFASIIIEDSLGIIITGGTTDINGNYIIKPIVPGLYNLKLSYIGYDSIRMEKIHISPDSISIINIEMTASTMTLEAVVVTAYRVPLINYDQCSCSSTLVASQVRRRRWGHRRISKRNANYNAYISEPQTYSSYSNNESYDSIEENQFMNVMEQALSTFSVDVDRASYSNVRRFLNNNQLPPTDAVRIEEMINYFHYDYPTPTKNQAFSIGLEGTICPWNPKHRIIQIGLKAKELDTNDIRPSNLVFLIDVSGSMSSNNKLPLVKKSMKILVDKLRPEDRVAIVVYAGAAGCVLKSTSGAKKEKILKAINRLSAEGSTAGGAGIELAYKIAKENFIKNGNNRVILATDGDFNVGVSNNKSLVKIIEKKRKDGVFLTITGYGMGNYKDNRMEQLSNAGNGNYAYIDNILEAEKVFGTELWGTLYTIAKDVKIQIEFNPAKIKSYRLIGYENRMLEAKDFNDDKKDAGEMGMGHCVTAIYEVIPANSDEETTDDKQIDSLKYQTKTVIASEELLTVKFRYKEPKGNKSKLISRSIYLKDIESKEISNNLLLSTSIAEFGLLLRNSKYKGEASYADVLSRAKKASRYDPFGYRTEFVKMIRTAKLLEN